MTIHLEEQRSSSSIDVKSFEVTISQIREDHHTYYRASAEARGKAANAYGQSPEEALSRLYDEVLPRVLGLRYSSGPAFFPRSDRRGHPAPARLRG